MKKICISIALLLSTMISACGGGGGGGTGSNDPPPPTQPTNIALQLSTSGSVPIGKIIRSVYTVITVPATVTVKTVNGSPDVVIPPAISASVETNATLVGNELTITVLSTDANGLPPGNFAAVNCSYTGSPAPQFAQPTAVVAGGPPGTFNTFDDLTGMGVTLTIQ